MGRGPPPGHPRRGRRASRGDGRARGRGGGVHAEPARAGGVLRGAIRVGSQGRPGGGARGAPQDHLPVQALQGVRGSRDARERARRVRAAVRGERRRTTTRDGRSFVVDAMRRGPSQPEASRRRGHRVPVAPGRLLPETRREGGVRGARRVQRGRRDGPVARGQRRVRRPRGDPSSRRKVFADEGRVRRRGGRFWKRLRPFQAFLPAFRARRRDILSPRAGARVRDESLAGAEEDSDAVVRRSRRLGSMIPAGISSAREYERGRV
mmetsp:Transcript_1258/g.4936  ORF Transcript_1258/g.4936 Transcript_1258/m.4936 type:complete len:265 (+) Transcript_1258:251-1045(+)